jgi:hypothetical protein
MNWLVEFAAKRSARLEEFDEEIHGIIAQSLANYGTDKWYDDIVVGASVLWLEIFEKSSPTGDPAGSIDTFTREVGEALARTSEPAKPPTEGEIDRVANWVGVYTVNSATYRAGVVDGAVEKTWVTMHDDHVRSLHRAVDGQTVPIRGTFDVDGFKLLFPGDPEGPPEVWINCRCLVAIKGGDAMGAKSTSFAKVDDPYPNEEEGDSIHVDDSAPTDEPLVDDTAETPWHGVLVVEGVETGDGRIFDPNSLSYGTLPLPISWQRMSADGHSQAVVVGRIDTIELAGNEHRATGMFNNNVAETNEVIDGIIFGMLGGVSVDVDNAEFTVESEDEGDEGDLMGMLFGGGKMTTRFTAGRIRGASLVSIPAFQEAYIALGAEFDETPRDPNAVVSDAAPGEDDAGGDFDEDTTSFDTLEELIGWLEGGTLEELFELDEQYSIVASAFAPGTHDGPGWITNPRATERLRKYWLHGEGAAKIRWGQPGDFNRCRLQLAKYINPAFLAGTCANLHKEALDLWPGRERGDKGKHAAAPAFSIIASAALDTIDASYFADPEFEHITALTIDGDHIFGHVAPFGECHIAIANACVLAPHSATDYSYFRVGVVDTTEGEVFVGQLTMGTGHASAGKGMQAAMAHYDNTGTAVADIATGEDRFGIWYSGKLRDDLSDSDRKALKAAKVSGDWRDRRGNLEMVGVLAVNIGGYPIPRTQFSMNGDVQLSLTAAGIIRDVEPPKSIVAAGSLTADDLLLLGRSVADELEYRSERKDRLSKVRDPELVAEAEGRRAERIAAAKSPIEVE